jgi:hypothetical protein
MDAERRRPFLDLLRDGFQLTPIPYLSEEGRWIFGVLRFDHPTKGKVIRPVRCSRMLGTRPVISATSVDPLRPLYGLDKLAARSNEPVLMVEGEFSADAAQRRFSDYVAITWPGGAPGVSTADLRPLVGRHITIWPDNDGAGKDAALRMANRAHTIGAASVKVVNVPTTLPEKWDLADPLPSDFYA